MTRSKTARRLLTITTMITLLMGAAACTTDDVGSAGRDSAAPLSGSDAESADQASGNPHVHGAAINPADQRLYLATHEGLFRFDDGGPIRVGPRIDLMALAAAAPNHFYASGHPGRGTDLPDPVGLIESVDAGRSWTPVSRQGQSDFHALTISAAGVLASDGTLWAAADGVTWQALIRSWDPAGLAASPDGRIVLAATSGGSIARSTDGGRSWIEDPTWPRLSALAWAANSAAVGVAADGTVYVSADAAQSWQQRGSAAALAVAAAASSNGAGPLRVLVVTGSGVAESIDGGNTFINRPYRTAE